MDYAAEDAGMDITVNAVTGLDNHLEPEINIYPNPVRDFVNIVFQPGHTEKIHVSVQGIEGKKIKEFVLTPGYPTGFYSIEVQDLPKGLYLIRLSSVNFNVVRKILKY